jgi:hypothetical protein
MHLFDFHAPQGTTLGSPPIHVYRNLRILAVTTCYHLKQSMKVHEHWVYNIHFHHPIRSMVLE